MIMKVVVQEPGINKRNLMKKVGIGTSTFYRNFDLLVEKGLLTYDEIGNQQKCYAKTREIPDYIKTKKQVQNEIKKLKRTIKKNLKLLHERSYREIVAVIETCFISIFSYIETIELLEIGAKIYNKKLPKYFCMSKLDLEKFMEETIRQLPPSRYEILQNTMVGRFHYHLRQLEVHEKVLKSLSKKENR